MSDMGLTDTILSWLCAGCSVQGSQETVTVRAAKKEREEGNSQDTDSTPRTGGTWSRMGTGSKFGEGASS
jgi:hypothetical protein